jgi:hypothetical protein
MPAYRSFLFAPGNRARKIMKVFDCGADHAILDSSLGYFGARRLTAIRY